MCLKTVCVCGGGVNTLILLLYQNTTWLLLFDRQFGFKKSTGFIQHLCFHVTAAAPSEMRASPLLPLIFAFIITTFSYTSDARYVCTVCQNSEECEKDPPELCIWGEARDNCNRRVCAKGPGERCGGPQNILGHCGEGMMCKNGVDRCYGCSIHTFQCYP